MPASLRRVAPRPLIGIVLCLAAIATVVPAWAANRPGAVTGFDLILLLCLIAAVAVSRWMPLRIGRSTHLYLASVPLYLLCCLFVPPIAAVATGLGMTAREISICRRCGNKMGDVAAQVGRWTLLSLAVSTIVHLWPADYLIYTGVLAGLLLWLGDVLTAPLVLGPITGQHPRSIVVAAARASYAGELMQYLLGLLTLMVLRSTIGWLGVFIYLPLILLSLLLLYLYLKSVDELAQPLPESARPRT